MLFFYHMINDQSNVYIFAHISKFKYSVIAYLYWVSLFSCLFFLQCPLFISLFLMLGNFLFCILCTLFLFVFTTRKKFVALCSYKCNRFFYILVQARYESFGPIIPFLYIFYVKFFCFCLFEIYLMPPFSYVQFNHIILGIRLWHT